MAKQLNIVFFGEDSFSDVILHSLIDAGHNVNLVVTPLYDNLIYKRLERTCLANAIAFYRAPKVNSEDTCKIVSKAQPDLCVIAHFERLIKQPLLCIPSMGYINLHPSLLPDYRGMAPQHQHRFPIDETMYVSDLQRIWLNHYKTIMVEAINAILEGKPTKEQKSLEGRYYGKLKKEQCVINKKGSVLDAYSLIRGVSLPYFGATYDDKVIYKAHIREDKESCDETKVLHFSDGDLVIDSYKMQE